MKIPGPEEGSARADDDIAALLSAADARIQSQKKGSWENQGDVAPVVVDLGAELRKNWLWVRPWRSKPVDPPDFSTAEPMGRLPGCRSKASAWCSRQGDPSGPWWALHLDGDPESLDTETIARCWRVWWRTQVRIFVELEDLTADAGDGPAAQAWLKLTWEEVVRLRGKVTMFPVPGHPDEPKVRAMAKDPHAISYLNAWLRAEGAPRRVPKVATLEAVEAHAANEARDALAVLEFARRDLARARSERGRARLNVAQQRRAVGGMAAVMTVLGLGKPKAMDPNQEAATRAEAGVIAAKRAVREAEKALKHKQEALEAARSRLEKAIRERLEAEQAEASKPPS